MMTQTDIGYDIAMARMHQTTIRFAPEMWAALESEAARSRVSIAHYVRDAAVSRLAFAAGLEQGRARDLPAQTPPESRRLADRVKAELNSAEAVRAQGQLARARARRLRAEADMLRSDGQTHRVAAEDEDLRAGSGEARERA
jgi:hypothetical protein